MTTYFIIANGNPRKVWHYERRGWACDIDAYYGRGFEYLNLRAATKRFNTLQRNGEVVDVVTRATLFDMLEVKDWAGCRQIR